MINLVKCSIKISYSTAFVARVNRTKALLPANGEGDGHGHDMSVYDLISFVFPTCTLSDYV